MAAMRAAAPLRAAVAAVAVLLLAFALARAAEREVRADGGGEAAPHSAGGGYVVGGLQFEYDMGGAFAGQVQPRGASFFGDFDVQVRQYGRGGHVAVGTGLNVRTPFS